MIINNAANKDIFPWPKLQYGMNSKVNGKYPTYLMLNVNKCQNSTGINNCKSNEGINDYL